MYQLIQFKITLNDSLMIWTDLVCHYLLKPHVIPNLFHFLSSEKRIKVLKIFHEITVKLGLKKDSSVP